MLTHCFEREIPVILAWNLGVSVIMWIFITPWITKPDIVSSSCSNKGRSHTWLVRNPTVCWVEDSMLEVDYFLSIRLCVFVWSRNSENSKYVSIISSDFVFFKSESILCDYLLKSFWHVWISSFATHITDILEVEMIML